MSEVQDKYRLVSNGFDAAVEAVTADQWGAQSPCEQWTARDVVAHVVQNHRGVIASVRGGESEPLGADEDLKQAWESARKAMIDITGDPEAVAKEIDGPTGKMPTGQISASSQPWTCSSIPGTWPERSVPMSVWMRNPSVRPMRPSSRWMP